MSGKMEDEPKGRERTGDKHKEKLLFCLNLVELDLSGWEMKKEGGLEWVRFEGGETNSIERTDKLCSVLDRAHIHSIQPVLWLSLWFQILIFIKALWYPRNHIDKKRHALKFREHFEEDREKVCLISLTRRSVLLIFNISVFHLTYSSWVEGLAGPDTERQRAEKMLVQKVNQSFWCIGTEN